MSANPVQTSYTTAPAAAYAGMLADDTENDLITMINEEASASIPFGSAVIYKGSPTSDKDATLPTGTSDSFAGVLAHEHDYERTFTLPDGTVVGELDGTGLTVGTVLSVLTRGTIWVKVMNAVVAGAAAHYSYSASGVYTAAGQWGGTGVSGHTVALAGAKWHSSAQAGGFAKLCLGPSQTITGD